MKRKKIPENKKFQEYLCDLEYSLRPAKLFPTPEPKPLTDEEIKQRIAYTKAEIHKWMQDNSNFNGYEEINVELKRKKHLFRGYENTEYYCDSAEPYNLLLRYKELKGKISNMKRKLTNLVQSYKLDIYKMNSRTRQIVDLVVPECIEYLEEEYYRSYNLLDEKTKIISKKEKELKEEIELVKKDIKKVIIKDKEMELWDY